MNLTKMNARDLSVVLVMALLFLGVTGLIVYQAVTAEGQIVLVNPHPDRDLTFQEIYQQYQAAVLPALKQYSLILGLSLVLASIAYIFLGRENDIATELDEPGKK